jgi:hypothetical protein
MSDNDKCIRCFEKETILHLLKDCPYSKEAWIKLRIDHTNTEEVLGIGLNVEALEIRAEFISKLVFSKGVLPPETLVKITIENFANKLSYKKGSREIAEMLKRDF